MSDQPNRFDQEPAEGSRQVIDHQLQEQEKRNNKVDHLPGVKVSGQPQGGAVDKSDK